jgi:hypothetical protein
MVRTVTAATALVIPATYSPGSLGFVTRYGGRKSEWVYNGLGQPFGACAPHFL